MLLIDETAMPDIARLHRAFLDGTETPLSLAEAALEAARAADAVFISLNAEQALEEAKAATARYAAGEPLGSLDGIPIAWKDLFDMAGAITTAGSDLLRTAAPVQTNAPSVSALKAAGMVSIGKTNLSEFAFSGLGLNPHYGTPVLRDILGRAHVPGGSSSGSAMAVRQGIVPVAMGTDTAGSIRIPAAFMGLVGYKSSSGRYGTQGVFPLARSFDSIGPIANTVADCALLDAALRGGVPPVLPADLSGLSLVIESRIIADPVIEPAVRTNLHALTERLARAGARLTIRPVPAYRAAQEAIASLGWAGSYEANRFHAARLAGPDRARMDPRTAARLERGALITTETYTALLALRERLQREIAADLAGEILITPTVAHVAPELQLLEEDAELFAATNLATLRLTMIGSFLNMPGIAYPSGRDRLGLATSLQLSAPSGADDTLLAAALAIEASLQA